jgi:subfamily B ATP-binding cassette protein MsbA
MGGRTILIITHRLETVRNVDHVVRIENGRVKGQGRPLDVMPEIFAPGE